MKSLKHYLAASLGLILFAGVIGLSLSQTGHAEFVAERDVRVVNLPTEPVPVVPQGTTEVAITNTPKVFAVQSGAWNVGINGTPTVMVGNSNPILVRDADRPTAQPFQRQFSLTIDAGENTARGSFTIPAGKLLVIERVSAFSYSASSTPTGRVEQKLEIYIETSIAPGAPMGHYLGKVDENVVSTIIRGLFTSGQVRLYAEDVFSVAASRSGTPVSVDVIFTVSGYFVDR